MRTAAFLIALSLTAALALRGGNTVPDEVVTGPRGNAPGSAFDRVITSNNQKLLAEGRQIFRFDTFGDEAFWGDTLKLHEGVAKISPKTALAVGLKVDMDALPRAVVQGVKNGTISLDDPATTAALLQLNAVVGVTGHFSPEGKMTSIGIQCALCHSTVDDAFAPGIGHRLDGWPNRDLNVGAIVNLSPDLSAVDQLLGVDDKTTRAVLASGGPGKFAAELFLDGKAFRPDGGRPSRRGRAPRR